MGKKKAKRNSSKSEAKAKKLIQLAKAKPKAKCCKSKTRCWKCPVVIHKLNKEIKAGRVDYDRLKVVAEKTRKRQLVPAH